MISLYAVNIEPLLKPDALQQAAQKISAPRQERAFRLPDIQGQAQRIAAGLLLRHLYGTDAVAYEPMGKPFFPYLPEHQFSLSHTDKWVLCATASIPVGLDAQMLTPYRPAIARRWFTAEEQRWIESDKDIRFTRLWTHKEAAAKLTGKGLVPSLGDPPPVFLKEYTDLQSQGVYVTVCAASTVPSCDRITMLTESLL